MRASGTAGCAPFPAGAAAECAHHDVHLGPSCGKEDGDLPADGHVWQDANEQEKRPSEAGGPCRRWRDEGACSVAVSDEQIARINFLARKSKAEGLTLEERQEQIELRQAYIKAVKDSLAPLLDSITVIEVDENGEPVAQIKHGQKTEIETVYTERVEIIEERIEITTSQEPSILPDTGDDTIA
jgi:uncharacterized protein YnzC (UPF0291/DUF896 family)